MAQVEQGRAAHGSSAHQLEIGAQFKGCSVVKKLKSTLKSPKKARRKTAGPRQCTAPTPRRAEPAVDTRHPSAELDSLYDTAPVGLCFVDTDLRIARLNQLFASITGCVPKKHIGRRLDDVLPALADQIMPVISRALNTAKPVLNFDIRGERGATAGDEGVWSSSFLPVKLADGTVIGVNLMVSDVTAERKANDELSIYRHIVSASPDLMSFVDANYVYRAVSHSYSDAHGRPPNQIVGHPISDLFGVEIFKRIIKPLLDRCLAGHPSRFQDWLRFGGRGERFMDVVFSPYVSEDGDVTGVIVSARDITERKHMEDDLRQTQVRFDQIANTIEDVVWITDTKHQRILYASAAYERIWGQSVKHLYENPLAWADAIHEADRQRVKASIAAIEDTGRYDEEYRIVRPDGQSRWIRDRGYPLCNLVSDVYQVVGIAQDITARKQAEEAKKHLETQLRSAQKMQAVGELAAGVAHDVNSLLMVILGNTQLAQSASRKSGREAHQRVESALALIQTSVERGKALVQKLLAFGRVTTWKAHAVSLNDVVRDTHKILGSLISRDIQIEVHCDSKLKRCKIDSGLLEQVVLNLLLNARDAIEGSGIVTIRTSSVELNERQVAAWAHAKPGSYVMLSVRDTGVGMDDATLQRVFEPFFTTKQVDKGTGLGLSIVYGIVEQAGGHIDVESEPGQGTEFRLYFPAVA